MGLIKVFGHKNKPLNSEVVIVPINWTLNSTFDFDKHLRPILNYSNEIELFHEFYGFQEKCKIACENVSAETSLWNKSINRIYEEAQNGTFDGSSIHLINEDFKKLTSFLDEKIEYWIQKEKLPLLIGGDSSLLLGSVKAVARFKTNFGILHLSEKPFLKELKKGEAITEGNSLFSVGASVPEVSKIVAVGLSSFSQQEYSIQRQNKEKIIWFSKRKINNYEFKGDSYQSICKKWINNLPEFVYLSINVSILKVLSIEEIEFALQTLIDSRRKIVGVDFNGVENEVGKEKQIEMTRLLYIVCKSYGRSRGKV